MLDFIVMQMSKINHKRAISKESLTNWLTDCLSTWGTDHEDSVGHVQTDRMPEWMTEKLSINQCITLENVNMRHSKHAIKKLVVFSYTIAITELTLRHFNEPPVNKMTKLFLFISEISKSKLELAKIFEWRYFGMKHGKAESIPWV